MKPLFILLLTVVVSCNNTSDEKAIVDTSVAETDTATIATDTTYSNATIEAEQNDSTIFVKFDRDSTSTTVSGTMKGMGHPVTVYIPIKQGKNLVATLQAEDSAANIRINQIFTPDGKADGPFGRELKRTLHQQGTYKLIIGENLMQGDEWKGNFTLTVVVI